MSNRLRSFVAQATIRADGASFSDGVVPAVISTGDVARDRARIEQAGWVFDNFRKNPVVLFAHNDGAGGLFGGGSRALPIARSSDELVEGERTTAVAHFDMADDFAREVLGKIERGFVNTTSVRWLPIKTRVDKTRAEDGKEANILVFERQELLEWSFVSVPTDPGASVIREDGRGIAIEDYAAPSLMVALERAQSLLEAATLTEDEQDAAARLYQLIAARVQRVAPLPSTAQDEITETLNSLTDALRGVAQAVAEMRARRSPDTRRIVAEAVAQATGHSLESVQAKLRS